MFSIKRWVFVTELMNSIMKKSYKRKWFNSKSKDDDNDKSDKDDKEK